MSSHHSGAYQCEVCDIDFSSKEEFEEHTKDQHSTESPTILEIT
jgi:hypothetical protein